MVWGDEWSAGLRAVKRRSAHRERQSVHHVRDGVHTCERRSAHEGG